MIDGDMNQKEAVSQADKKIDRFIVLMKRRLGRGNFSEVYAGVDTGNHCQVAIKIVSLNSLSSDITRRLFSREVCILKTISHPNVLKCF